MHTVVRLEEFHAELEHILHMRTQYLIVWQAIEHLKQHIAYFLFWTICELRLSFQQQLTECRKQLLQKVAILARMHDLDGVSHLGDELLTLLDSCKACT